MPRIPDLADPRFLDEIGWFVYHEQNRRDVFGGSYEAERIAYSKLFLREVLGYCGEDPRWLADKSVVSIGSGCTGDLAAWPAAVKIAVDPLLYAYQKLGMLLDDVAGTSRTVYLSVGGEELPLVDECAELVVCRNALDHLPDPSFLVGEMWRILREEGRLFVSVDIGGEPTPDEPTVFSLASLAELLARDFDVVKQTEGHAAHSGQRDQSVRLLARKRGRPPERLDKEALLRAYTARVAELMGWSR